MAVPTLEALGGAGKSPAPAVAYSAGAAAREHAHNRLPRHAKSAAAQ